MSYSKFDPLVARARAGATGRKVVAVVAAQDHHTLEAVRQSVSDGVVSAILIGAADEIRRQLAALGENASQYRIIDVASPVEAAKSAVALIHSGEAHFIMKGLIQTADLLRVVFSAESGLRTGALMSHLGIVDIPNYPKLIGLTDVAINIAPSLEQKKAIIENAVAAMSRMGFEHLKVALLAANEQVNEKMPESVDADALKRMNRDGWLAECLIEGPLSYDLAMSRESAEIKGIDSPVCGDADLLVVPTMTTGNTLLKALRYSARATSAGIVVGGKAPIVLTSRAVEPIDKYLPLAIAASAAM